MSEKRNLFPVSVALGAKNSFGKSSAAKEAAPAPVDTGFGDMPAARFALVARDGRCWSYPYSYVSLIECPSPNQILIQCNCRAVKSIVIRGRGLDEIVGQLTLHRGVTIAEADHVAYAPTKTAVTEISVTVVSEAS